MIDRWAVALRTNVVQPTGGEREAVVLRISDDSGKIGWGEASPLPGYSPDDLEAVEQALDRWAGRWETGEVSTSGETDDDPAFDDDLALLPAARCAVDTALLDLAARRLGVPLHARLLDRSVPVRPVERLPVASLVELGGGLRATTERVAEGYKTVKFKMGTGTAVPDFAGELDWLDGVRREFPYLKIRLDVNGRWSADEATSRLAEIKSRVDVEFVEQPVGPEELLSFGRAPVMLAADESLRIPGAIDELAGGCGVVVLKPMVLGGLRACLRLAETAFGQGMRAVVSHTFGGPVAHAAACELALATASIDPVSGPLAAGLAGHDDLPQLAGPWIEPAAIDGHGVEGPW